ncbi:hypothetical protein [Bizionia arctica]|uniref:Carboxypeptidase-like regulatory domain-containing protein n=1 Tax=Bizionia arctica TaxID=1495645 RepID=A0A917GEE2_9FLAO|nr:hypothetical protein [Bizionia arctica]GGG41410.1 hypothetical protein GCM10010976_11280 [Bizionia arctica]
MKKINLFLFLFLIICFETVFSQTVEITGKVTTTLDVENIHVINKTAQVFTTTNAFGGFKISAKLNDTLQFTSIQHKLKEVVVDANILVEKQLDVHLEELTYSLDEVVVGRMLSGDLMKDLNNVEGNLVTANQLGIPSYQGKLKTQSERKLNEATTGGGFIPLNPILNAISGRTKELKNQIKLERQDDLLYDVRRRTEKLLFLDETLPETSRTDYFYFCSEDSNFVYRCKGRSDIEIIEFLKEKLIEYKANLKIETN